MSDIKAMFAEAAMAAEDTGENEKLLGKKDVPEPKVEEKIENKPIIRPKEPIIDKSNKIEGLSVKAIEKVIKMKETLDNYEAKELEFVKGYFQQDEESSSEIIFSALTIERRGLDALNKIVIARNHSAAERAFYLMELDNNSIESIYEQIELIVGGFDKPTPAVSASNKIEVCRILENSIANMPDDVFKFIDKLQDFTNIALD